MMSSEKNHRTLPAILSLALLTFLLAACSNTTNITSTTTASSSKTSILPVTSTTNTTHTSSTSTTTTTTTTSSNGSSTTKRPATPIQVIRMINQVGWALTKNAIIRTTNYGNTWQDVTPNITLGGYASGDFMDSENTWVAFSNSNNTVYIERTSDGGQSWQVQNYTIQ